MKLAAAYINDDTYGRLVALAAANKAAGGTAGAGCNGSSAAGSASDDSRGCACGWKGGMLIMGKDSKIEWCHHTFNPWWGCEKVSPACAHCYAETWAKRCGAEVWGARADRRVFGEKHWNEPVRWDAKAGAAGVRERVFCASMADVFEGRPELDPERERLWKLIEMTQNLDWLLLTKRPQLVLRLLPQRWKVGGLPNNVWIGTTVENQAMADERIPWLLEVPAAVRFLSCEPLLGPVDLGSMHYCANCFGLAEPVVLDDGTPWCSGCESEMPGYVLDPCLENYEGINWVICGGESGPGARPMHPDWARGLRDQCAAAGVGGERENALRMLEAHLKRHGLTLDMLRSDDRQERDLECWMPGTKPLARPDLVQLAAQCLMFVMNQKVVCFSIRTRREWRDGKGKRIWVPCLCIRAAMTELEFEDWKACFLHFLPDYLESHRRMKLALKQCLNGFVHQHCIFRETDASDDRPLSEEELQGLIDAMRGAQGRKWERPAGRLEQPGFLLA